MKSKLKVIEESKPWYADGLRFKCTECGQCCTGAPGYVWVNDQEIEQIASHLNLSIEEFAQRYLRRVRGRLSLLEHPKTFDCVFLKDKKCQIYSIRPTQCRTFPWWPRQLKSAKDWQEAAQYCEGIQSDAPLVPFEVIEQQRLIQENESNGH
ncbi:MAG: YkgJ family cysteine cluster protein [Chlamydiales bacterium]